MPLIWKEHLSIGNTMLDFEHRNLIGMINSIEYLINKNDIPALLKAIELLKNCVHTHFANEARFAQALNFNFEQHDLAHQHLLKELESTLCQLAGSDMLNEAWCNYAMGHYPKFLRDWFIEHINSKDMEMKPLLQSYPHDFKPA